MCQIVYSLWSNKLAASEEERLDRVTELCAFTWNL